MLVLRDGFCFSWRRSSERPEQKATSSRKPRAARRERPSASRSRIASPEDGLAHPAVCLAARVRSWTPDQLDLFLLAPENEPGKVDASSLEEADPRHELKSQAQCAPLESDGRRTCR